MLLIPPLPSFSSSSPSRDSTLSLSLFRLFPWKLFAFDTDPLRRGVSHSHSIRLLLRGYTVILIRPELQMRLIGTLGQKMFGSGWIFPSFKKRCPSGCGGLPFKITVHYILSPTSRESFFRSRHGTTRRALRGEGGRAEYNECFAIAIDSHLIDPLITH